MVYDDFVIQILPGPGNGYTVHVESQAGGGKEHFGIPADLQSGALETFSLDTRDFVQAAGAAAAPSPKAREIGDRLFQALFKGKVRTAFDQSIGTARALGRGLRIRLKIDPEAGRALALPWELLHYAETDDFLGLDRKTPVVRCLEVLRPAAGLKEHHLRILAVASAPRGWSSLDLECERRNLNAACNESRDVEIVFLQQRTIEALRSALTERPFHVLHFMGHGTFNGTEGTLLFEDQNGEPLPVTGRDLALELKDFPTLRLVVLNACQTARMAEEQKEGKENLHPFAGVASALLKEGIPAVVAMRSSIPDKAAIAFSQAFYQQLAAGEPVDAAVTAGRKAICHEAGEDGGWNLPVLFLLGEDGEIFRGRGLRPVVKAWTAAIGLVLLVLFFGVSCRKSYQVLEKNNAGAVAAENKRYGEARAALLSALKLDPEYAAAHSTLVDVEEKAGNYAEALVHARDAVRFSPSQAPYQYNLGRLLVRLGGHDQEALESLQKAIDQKPCHREAFNEMANVYLDLGQLAKARRVIEAGLRCQPPLPYLYKNLGRVALEEGRPREAITALEEAVRLYAREGLDTIEEPTYWLAEAYARDGQWDLACERLRDFNRLTSGVSHLVDEERALAQQESCEGVL